MANKWITLTDSIGNVSKRFICVFPGYRPYKERRDTLDTTLEAELDISRGGIYKTFEYLLRVRMDEADPDYGDQSDLEYFYDLNNPNGSPSDVITLTDHYENQWLVAMTGNYEPQVQTVYLEGEFAFAIIPVNLRVLGSAGDSGS